MNTIQNLREARGVVNLREARGVVGFGEPLIEVPNLAKIRGHFLSAGSMTDGGGGVLPPDATCTLRDTRRTPPEKEIRILAELLRLSGEEKVRVAGDIVNVLHYLGVLPQLSGTMADTRSKLHCVFAGTIGTADGLGQQAALSFPVPIALGSTDPNRQIGVYGIEVTKEGQGNIPHYDRRLAASRDALSHAATRKRIADLAAEQGLLITSLIGLGITRNTEDFLELLRLAKDMGATICFDTNYRPFVMQTCMKENPNNPSPRAAFEAALHYVDVLLAGREDLRLLYPQSPQGEEEIPTMFRQLPPDNNRVTIIKAGEAGAYWWESGSIHRMPAEKVRNIVDTTGAGDAFNAALLLALREGEEMSAAMQHAAHVGACVVQAHGAQLTAEELRGIEQNSR